MSFLVHLCGLYAAQSLRLAAPIILLAGARLMLRGRLPQQTIFLGWVILAAGLLCPLAFPITWGARAFAAPRAFATTLISRSTSMHVPATATVVDAGAPRTPSHPLSLAVVVTLIWLSGAAILIALRMTTAFRAQRRIARQAQPPSPALDRLNAECAHHLGLPRPLPLRLSDAVSGPVVSGLWRPAITLPTKLAEQLAAPQLRLILLHESAHAKRRDLLAKWMIQMAADVHWFNPLAWLFARWAAADCEAACDESVLGRLPPADQGDYGRTLLQLSSLWAGRAPSPAFAGIIGKNAAIKRRIQLIANFKPFRFPSTLAGYGFLALLSVAALTRTAVAQGEPAGVSPYDALTPFVGTWQGTFPLNRSGKVGTLEMKITPLEDEEGQRFDSSLTSEGKRYPISNGILTWNPAEKRKVPPSAAFGR